MHILCDQHVASKYVKAFELSTSFTVTTVREVLSADASDTAIAEFAATNGWVIFTNDDDFYTDGQDHGLLVYSQIADPPPGQILDAVWHIEKAYTSPNEILEYVPGEWV